LDMTMAAVLRSIVGNRKSVMNPADTAEAVMRSV